ncbi:MAG TPA: acetate--CoA ligase family protein [Candidatus Acidoferrum sp.]|nr:acetate--CoA ligase family protein [Candidatus Acidoferrum sp.]
MLVDYDVAKRVLDKYKIRSIRSSYVTSEDIAVKFWNGKGRIVLKVLSQKALHKSKSGLVMLDLGNEDEIRSAYKALSKKAAKLKPYKIIAQEMAPKGIEIIIGGNIDAQFGKTILLGLGGIYVETFKDFALRICPITRYDALSMISQLRSKGIVAPDDKSKEMITDLIMKASKMFDENDFEELDLNPIIIHDGTYEAVDLRMLR